MEPEEYLAELGFDLRANPSPAAKYEPVVVCGETAFVSGCLPIDPSGNVVTGRLGDDVDTQAAHGAARLCAANALRALYAQLGSFQPIKRVVKITGFVACTPHFQEAHLVINGASEALHAALGARGRHARSAVGVTALPLGACVEVEAFVELQRTDQR